MKKVMVVDDSRFMYDEISRYLSGTNYNVCAYCRDAEQALDQYSSVRPDVVLMDIILPGIDGIAATEQLLEKWPKANVIMVSSLAYDDTISRARDMGAKSFLFKPVDADQLLEVLEEVVGS